MSDVIRKIISGNNIRHGDPVTGCDQKGNFYTVLRAIKNGVLDSETYLTNKYTENQDYTPYTDTLTLTSPVDQFTWAIPEGTKKYVFHSRNTSANLLYAFENGIIASSGDYNTLNGGVAFESPDNFQASANSNVYISSATSGTVVEFTYWQ